jgi:hypothetical protein
MPAKPFTEALCCGKVITCDDFLSGKPSELARLNG